jgi:hypothetical protein
MTTTTEPQDVSERRTRLPWVIAGGLVVVAAVAVTMMLATGHAGDGAPTNAASTASAKAKAGAEYDLSSPQAAAESLVKAAKTGSGETLLGLTCVGRPDCVREHATAMSEQQLAEAQDTIREGVFELGQHLAEAEFTSAVDGDEPGTKEVPYRTPEMTGDAYLSLTFIQSGGDWLFYQPQQ